MFERKGDVALKRCLQIVQQNMNVRNRYNFLVLFIKCTMRKTTLMSPSYILVNPVIVISLKV